MRDVLRDIRLVTSINGEETFDIRCLGVCIHQGHRLTLAFKGLGKMYSHGGFSGASFPTGDCDSHETPLSW
jgi:hypothetical protein